MGRRNGYAFWKGNKWENICPQCQHRRGKKKNPFQTENEKVVLTLKNCRINGVPIRTLVLRKSKIIPDLSWTRNAKFFKISKQGLAFDCNEALKTFIKYCDPDLKYFQNRYAVSYPPDPIRGLVTEGINEIISTSVERDHVILQYNYHLTKNEIWTIYIYNDDPYPSECTYLPDGMTFQIPITHEDEKTRDFGTTFQKTFDYGTYNVPKGTVIYSHVFKMKYVTKEPPPTSTEH